MKIFLSLASCDVIRIAQEIDRLEGWPWLHFDIEDANFTPNMTFGQKMLRTVGKYIFPRQLDVHLMTIDPLSFLEPARESGAESVCAHIEALRFPMLFLNQARALGMRAGLALNISTPLEAICPFIACMDYLLVMTAEPDNRGEILCTPALEKAIKATRVMPLDVYADGALDDVAIERLYEAGSAGCVLGRLIFRDDNPADKLMDLKTKFNVVF